MKNKLNILKQEFEELNKKLDDIAIKNYGMDKFGGFPSKSILKDYTKSNRQYLEHLMNLKDQIEKLEWDLMTPEEKERQKKYKKFLRLKAKGEPFDLDEFI